MRYYIGFMFEEDFQRYYDGLIADLSERFGISPVQRIAHITLKSPFEFAQIGKLEELVEGFCEGHDASSFFVNGFGYFDGGVIYFNIIPSSEMISTFGFLLEELRKVSGLSWSEYDREDKILHATLIKEDEMQGEFEKVWAYVSCLRPYFDLAFDNIAIFKKDFGGTRIYRKDYFGD